MSVTLYSTSVSSNSAIKQHISRIKNVLESKKIPFVEVDISTTDGAKDKMREISGNATQLPPVLSNGDQFCGDFDAFEAAVEDEKLNDFLKL